MPDVSPVGNGPAGPLNRGAAPSPAKLNGAAPRDGAAEPSPDRVEVSEHARLLDRLRRLPDVRTDRVENVRAAIESGRYETDERLNVAIERLLEDLGDTN